MNDDKLMPKYYAIQNDKLFSIANYSVEKQFRECFYIIKSGPNVNPIFQIHTKKEGKYDLKNSKIIGSYDKLAKFIFENQSNFILMKGFSRAIIAEVVGLTNKKYGTSIVSSKFRDQKKQSKHNKGNVKLEDDVVVTHYGKVNKNDHYFLLMHPLEVIATPYGPFVYTTGSSREKWVECKIVEEEYELSKGYKIELKSLEDGYGKESFYLSDFFSLIESGHIVKKTPDLHCVEEKWVEPLTDLAYLNHSAYTLKKKK